jgi:invasion protein IalB
MLRRKGDPVQDPDAEFDKTEPVRPLQRMVGATPLWVWGGAALLAIAVVAGIVVLTGVGSSSPQAPAPAVAAATPPQAAAPSAGSAAPAGATAQQPAPPQPVVTKRETYEDWIYACIQSPGSPDIRCSISQRLSDEKSKGTIFHWRIAQDGEGGLVGIWQTPPQVLLSRGITIEAGTPQPITVPYEKCAPNACRAVAALAPDFIETLTKAQAATATIVLQDGRPVKLALSIKGLATGLAALKQAAPGG